MNTSKTQQGFTLIELVIVIVILGILAATALPRFMNVTEQAHNAAVQGAGGGLGSAVQLVRAQWIANAEAPGEGTVAEFGSGNVSVSSDGDATTSQGDGWPTGITDDDSIAAAADSQCVAIWNNVMQNPPTIIATTATNGFDYFAVATADTCTYTYVGAGLALTNRVITYNATTGAVTVTVPAL